VKDAPLATRGEAVLDAKTNGVTGSESMKSRGQKLSAPSPLDSSPWKISEGSLSVLTSRLISTETSLVLVVQVMADPPGQL
jgi:hypothetical protein